MVSGAELDFKNDLQEKNVGLDSPMSRKKIGQKARELADTYQAYGKKQKESGEKIMLAKNINKLDPKEKRQLNRDTGADFTK